MAIPPIGTDPEELARALGLDPAAVGARPPYVGPGNPQIPADIRAPIRPATAAPAASATSPDTSLNAPVTTAKKALDASSPAQPPTHKPYFSDAENNINNPILRTLAKVGDVAGTALVPGLTAAIPGTRLSEIRAQNRDMAVSDKQAEIQGRQAGTAHTEAETEAIPATTAHTEAETEAIANAPDPDKVKSINEGYARAIQNWHEAGGQGDPMEDPQVKAWAAAAQAIQKPANQSTKEKLQAQLIQAQNANDKPLAAKLQKQIKDIDPMGEQRTAITISQNAEHKSEHDQGRQDKVDAAQKKELKPYTDLLTRAQDAHDSAGLKTGPGDYALLMDFVDATKPSSGFRFTESERKMIMHARGLTQDMEGLWNKASTGRLITDEQAQQMLQIMDLKGKEAQGHIDKASGGGSSNSSASEGSHDLEYIPGRGLVPAGK